MAKKKQNNTSYHARNGVNDPDGHKEKFLQYFEQEHPILREELANILPAYNMLLSLHAKTFEELSLLVIAKGRGMDVTSPRFSLKDVRPNCTKCGSEEKVYRVEENLYYCRACKKKFSLNQNSICSDTKASSLRWMQVLQCLLDHRTVKETRRYCGDMASKTFYNIRTKLFYAMQIMLEDVKLYGLIECDNTEVHLSYKGIDLTDEEYPEGSVFDTINLIPRPARKRGGAYPNADKNVNSVHMYAAIDNYGHSIIRYVGIGSATATKLERAVPFSRYLKEVPEKDPFPFTARKPNPSKYTSKETLLVADGETAIAKYAATMGIPYEARKNRKNGKQLRLGKDSHDVQRANALHYRFKTFFQRTNFVSSRYLPGFLVLFEFVENTGASPEAIGRLFEILVTPGLGQSKEFFEKLYSVPDIYTEWAADNVALKRIPYNHMLAAFMYHKKKEAEAAGKDPGYKMQDIMEATGFQSSSSVRRIYKNIAAARLMDDVCGVMEAPKKLIREKVQAASVAKVPEVILRYYDDFCSILQSPEGAEVSFEEIHRVLDEKHGLSLKRNRFHYYVTYIEGRGFRKTRLADLKAEAIKRRKAIASPDPKSEAIFTAYNAIWREVELSGEKPRRSEILKKVGEMFDLAPDTVAKHFTLAKKQRRKDFENAEHGKNHNENDS